MLAPSSKLLAFLLPATIMLRHGTEWGEKNKDCARKCSQEES